VKAIGCGLDGVVGAHWLEIPLERAALDARHTTRAQCA
jgi:hypothetical protein